MNINQVKKTKHQQKSSSQPAVTTDSIWNKEMSFGGNKISDKEKFTLYHQLFNLIDAGIDISYAFEVLENQIKSKKTRAKISEISKEVVNGKTLSESMADSKYFSKYEYYSIRIGEETGKLNDVLHQLHIFYEEKMAQKKQMIGALSYPLLIFVSSIGAVAFMMLFIIPLFEEIFTRFGNKLPWITRQILTLSEFFQSNSLYLLLVVLVCIGLNKLFSANDNYRRIKEKIILSLPVFGELYRTIYLARFCTSMSLLVKSEVPIISALDMVKNMINFKHLEIPIASIRERIIAGDSLHGSMGKFRIFDFEMLGLIKVGEEVNRLGDFFGKLSANYTENAKHKTALMGTVLEPVLIIFLGLIVAIILVAMYLPMFELSSSMGIG
ncbi:MAG: type II secretion system F family protein [Cyclobacteriaceae bacterium]